MLTIVLLDLTVAETALVPFESWLKPARQLADVLFPARFSTTGFIRLAPMNV